MPHLIKASPIARRSFLVTGIAAGAAAFAGGTFMSKPAHAEGAFEVPKLAYDYAALEPHIDAETMKIHHDTHHGAYVKGLNDTLAGKADLMKLTIEELLADKGAKVPEDIRQKVINMGGGHYNHSLFWTSLAAAGNGGGGEPKGPLADAIKSTFTDFKTFTAKMNEGGIKRFGSGWVWLSKTADGKLEIASTANQDTTLSLGMKPLLGIDVWEHAYYLKYRAARAKYLEAIWNVINWAEVEKRFA